MNDYSQAGQDQFVLKVLGATPIDKVFLDIGAAGRSISNTLALEELGWTGWLVDNSPEAQKDSAGRKAPFILADATQLDYSFLPSMVDYLSLDIDGATYEALITLPLHRTRFRVITIEHDAYARGNTLRIPMRGVLAREGYQMVCADVANPDPFEDWWVDASLVDSDAAYRMLSSGRQWKDILA